MKISLELKLGLWGIRWRINIVCVHVWICLIPYLSIHLIYFRHSFRLWRERVKVAKLVKSSVPSRLPLDVVQHGRQVEYYLDKFGVEDDENF